MAVDLRPPNPQEGFAVHQLVAQCPPLDPNSLYCNLLQCSHFADTSVAALSGDRLIGFISAYLVPGRPDTLFVWQVAVGEAGRGQGLATRMLRHILRRPVCNCVSHVETTITAENQASWALFRGLADKLDTGLEQSVLFDREREFRGRHDSEILVRIGPF